MGRKKKIEGFIAQKFIAVAMFVIANLLSLGVMVPILVGADNDLEVIVGVISAILIVAADIVVGTRLVRGVKKILPR